MIKKILTVDSICNFLRELLTVYKKLIGVSYSYQLECEKFSHCGIKKKEPFADGKYILQMAQRIRI